MEKTETVPMFKDFYQKTKIFCYQYIQKGKIKVYLINYNFKIKISAQTFSVLPLCKLYFI